MTWHIENDIFALAIFLIMLVKTGISTAPKTHQEVGFDLVLKISLGITFINLLGGLAMEYSLNWWLSQIMVSLSCACLPALAMTWSCYAVGLVSHNDRKWAWRAITSMAIPLQGCLLFGLTNFAHGLLFTLTPEIEFVPGPLLVPFVGGAAAAYSLVGLVLSLHYRSRIKPSSHVAVLVFVFVVTTASVFIDLSLPGYLLACPTYAVVFILCDATIQDQRRRDLMVELSQAVDAAQKANEAKTQFFARMSHDMRTPLNGILGLSSLVLKRETDPKNKSDLEQLELSGEYLLHLVNDTLDISKIESGKMELNPQPTNPLSLASNVGSNAKTLADEKGVILLYHMPDPATIDKSAILIDGSRLEQVLMNIVSNAVKFTPEGGHVTLSFSSNASPRGKKFIHYCFSVEDDGQGMSADFLPHLFDAYSQETPSGGQGQGTGLGMSIVKQLTDMMGGTVKVKSEPGRGTTIQLDYDFARCDESLLKKGKPVDLSVLEGKRILMVEDHPINAHIAIEILKDKGMEVDWRDNGKKGVEAFNAAAPGYYDCVLMDIRMPVMNGLEAAAAIRAGDHPDATTTPIIALTANAFESDIRATREAGMNDHVAKPFEPEHLFTTIAALCQ